MARSVHVLALAVLWGLDAFELFADAPGYAAVFSPIPFSSS
jgi:hypothetical protein